MAARRRLSAGFNLGGEQAEADPLLEAAFYESGVYTSILARDDPHCFLIGRTGSGKSAVLQRLEEAQASHVIRIDPENLSLPYILDLGVVQHLSALGVHLDPLFIALWKHIFVVELIRHRYNVDSPEVKQSVFAGLLDRVKRDPSKKSALEYLDQFGESFWCETDEEFVRSRPTSRRRWESPPRARRHFPASGKPPSEPHSVARRATRSAQSRPSVRVRA